MSPLYVFNKCSVTKQLFTNVTHTPCSFSSYQRLQQKKTLMKIVMFTYAHPQSQVISCSACWSFFYCCCCCICSKNMAVNNLHKSTLLIEKYPLKHSCQYCVWCFKEFHATQKKTNKQATEPMWVKVYRCVCQQMVLLYFGQ